MTTLYAMYLCDYVIGMGVFDICYMYAERGPMTERGPMPGGAHYVFIRMYGVWYLGELTKIYAYSFSYVSGTSVFK